MKCDHDEEDSRRLDPPGEVSDSDLHCRRPKKQCRNENRSAINQSAASRLATRAHAQRHVVAKPKGQKRECSHNEHGSELGPGHLDLLTDEPKSPFVNFMNFAQEVQTKLLSVSIQ